eukprot:3066482-Rhodomonas_salina.1
MSKEKKDSQSGIKEARGKLTSTSSEVPFPTYKVPCSSTVFRTAVPLVSGGKGSRWVGLGVRATRCMLAGCRWSRWESRQEFCQEDPGRASR